MKLVDINVGDKFSMLTVIREVERWQYPSGDTRRQFLMQCDCGSLPKKLLISSFKTGNTTSCGCYNKLKTTTHGMHNTRQYQCWADMKTRCDCKDNKFYDYYADQEAAEIWDLLKSKQFFQRELAEMYDVKPSVISSISKGKVWTHITKAPRVY